MIKLGIFWIDQNNIFALQEAIDSVISIDDVRDIGTGHVDYWATLQRENSQFKDRGYDHIPRGRVLERKKKIVVYSCKDIIQNYQDLITNSFNLPKEKIEFIVDEHYAPILDLGYENFNEDED